MAGDAVKKIRVNDDAIAMIREQRSFTNYRESFSGQRLDEHSWLGLTTGCLPQRWHDSLMAATYAVWSYATPIAWFDPTLAILPSLDDPHAVDEWLETAGPLGRWVMPAVRYSPTTGQHQGSVRTALGSHYHYTDHATRDYKAFDRVAAGGERMWR